MIKSTSITATDEERIFTHSGLIRAIPLTLSRASTLRAFSGSSSFSRFDAGPSGSGATDSHCILLLSVFSILISAEPRSDLACSNCSPSKGLFKEWSASWGFRVWSSIVLNVLSLSAAGSLADIILLSLVSPGYGMFCLVGK